MHLEVASQAAAVDWSSHAGIIAAGTQQRKRKEIQ